MIKEVEKIPETLQQKRESYRAKIRADIEEAMSKRISDFEFEGDYNYKYLQQYAREEGERIFRYIFIGVERAVEEELKKELEVKYIYCPSPYLYAKQFIKVIKRKGEDRNHVYAHLDFDYLDNLKDLLYRDTKKKYEDILRRKKE